MENERKYSWKYGQQVSAQVVGEQFEAIEKRDGSLTKKAVVEAARPEDSPMHSLFEWDDAVAGELFRENQAGYYIRTLEVEIVPVGGKSGKAVTMRGFVNVAPVAVNQPEGKGVFVNVERAIRTPDSYRAMLERAKNELRMFREKYRDVKELEPVMAVINQVTMEEVS